MARIIDKFLKAHTLIATCEGRLFSQLWETAKTAQFAAS